MFAKRLFANILLAWNRGTRNSGLLVLVASLGRTFARIRLIRFRAAFVRGLPVVSVRPTLSSKPHRDERQHRPAVSSPTFRDRCAGSDQAGRVTAERARTACNWGSASGLQPLLAASRAARRRTHCRCAMAVNPAAWRPRFKSVSAIIWYIDAVVIHSSSEFNANCLPAASSNSATVTSLLPMAGSADSSRCCKNSPRRAAVSRACATLRAWSP